MTITEDQMRSTAILCNKLLLGEMNAVLNHPLHIKLPPMSLRKRIVPALELLLRGRVTIPGPRL
jgi:hypothetical protein